MRTNADDRHSKFVSHFSIWSNCVKKARSLPTILVSVNCEIEEIQFAYCKLKSARQISVEILENENLMCTKTQFKAK